MKVQYLEIVTPDVGGVCAVYEASLGLKFGDPEPMLGNSRRAEMEDGGQVGVRAPMHDTEEPVVRPYYLTNNIEKTTDAAVAAGAELAHPVMELPGICHFSILLQGGTQFGFWKV